MLVGGVDKKAKSCYNILTREASENIYERKQKISGNSSASHLVAILREAFFKVKEAGFGQLIFFGGGKPSPTPSN